MHLLYRQSLGENHPISCTYVYTQALCLKTESKGKELLPLLQKHTDTASKTKTVMSLLVRYTHMFTQKRCTCSSIINSVLALPQMY
jgi:hypothetical protein